MTRALFLTRALQAATFTGVRTPKVKALGVVELWFLYQARRGDVVQLAIPALGRGWAIPRAELVAGMFAPATTDTGVLIASGPRRTRLLLPSHDGTPGRVALYTPRGPLLAALCDTTAVVPFQRPADEQPVMSGRWSA